MIKVEKDLKNIPSSLLANPPKIDDEVRKRLDTDFNSKCCYCEDSEIKGEVEHFFPKSPTKFPHLEYEWENLLWACHDCNNLKGDKYKIEKPIINPTKDNPEPMLLFDLEGNIADNQNDIAGNSIEICKLNRKNLKDKRKSVADEFLRNLEFISEIGDKDLIISYIDMFFIEPLRKNKKLNFVALRNNIVENHLSKILSDI